MVKRNQNLLLPLHDSKCFNGENYTEHYQAVSDIHSIQATELGNTAYMRYTTEPLWSEKCATGGDVLYTTRSHCIVCSAFVHHCTHMTWTVPRGQYFVMNGNKDTTKHGKQQNIKHRNVKLANLFLPRGFQTREMQPVHRIKTKSDSHKLPDKSQAKVTRVSHISNFFHIPLHPVPINTRTQNARESTVVYLPAVSSEWFTVPRVLKSAKMNPLQRLHESHRRKEHRSVTFS